MKTHRRTGEHPFIGAIETSRNITARVIERDTSGEIYYFLEDSRAFRTSQHGHQSCQDFAKFSLNRHYNVRSGIACG
ncbi:hypothetical protein TNCV_2791331 [Trichonephila clavipes]|nr:hypothetical protein TNCV_2791331 [Trichonephila clavipes]